MDGKYKEIAEVITTNLLFFIAWAESFMKLLILDADCYFLMEY